MTIMVRNNIESKIKKEKVSKKRLKIKKNKKIRNEDKGQA